MGLLHTKVKQKKMGGKKIKKTMLLRIMDSIHVLSVGPWLLWFITIQDRPTMQAYELVQIIWEMYWDVNGQILSNIMRYLTSF